MIEARKRAFQNKLQRQRAIEETRKSILYAVGIFSQVPHSDA